MAEERLGAGRIPLQIRQKIQGWRRLAFNKMTQIIQAKKCHILGVGVKIFSFITCFTDRGRFLKYKSPNEKILALQQSQ